MKLVFVNGIFDILHRGHIELLNYAKGLGNYLIVAIDSDERVREKKGPRRPINNQEERKYILENIKSVNDVFIFYSDKSLENLIYWINPDVMVVGSDWKDKPVIGSEYVKELKFFDRIDNYATTKIIQSIITG
jgi:D-beta-D-heptose 7-phosphate kinase/D-beta-D-heptose 1-phosphate adenosyltransferase